MTDFKSSKLSRLFTLSSALAKASVDLSIDKAREKLSPYLEQTDQLKYKINATKEIVKTMGELKGAMMKLGQMISISDDLILPKEITDLFKDLQKNSPPMKTSEIDQMFKNNFNQLPTEVFHSFDYRPIAAASIGQVHKAQLKSGEIVAVKIQYPKIVEAIKHDFQNLNRIDRLIETLYPGKPNLDEIIEELKLSLSEECDYLHELNRMVFFKNQYAEKFPMVYIPTAYPDLSTSEILTMEWVEGDSFEESLSYSQSDKDFLGQSLFDVFLYSLWELNSLHTDPQNGNYLFKNNQIIMLDFGSTRTFSKNFVCDYCALLMSLETNNVHLYGELCKSLKLFKVNEDPELIAAHFKMITELYSPYLKLGKFPINPDIRLFDQLKEFLKLIEMKGRSSPHREFLLLDRSTLGLYSKLKNWKSSIDWQGSVNKYRFNVSAEAKLKYSQLG